LACVIVRGKKTKSVSIYANNVKRKFCTKYEISTSFVCKGKAAKDEQLREVLRSELLRERTTQLEDCFGIQKQHYSLSRMKVWIRKFRTDK